MWAAGSAGPLLTPIMSRPLTGQSLAKWLNTLKPVLLGIERGSSLKRACQNTFRRRREKIIHVYILVSWNMTSCLISINIANWRKIWHRITLCFWSNLQQEWSRKTNGKFGICHNYPKIVIYDFVLCRQMLQTIFKNLCLLSLSVSAGLTVPCWLLENYICTLWEL